MGLRKKRLNDPGYYAQADAIKAEIVRICDSEASDPGIQDLQGIFRKNPHRLYHWAHDRRVPADNNYSERSLRPLVIARKLSFGTQSARGSRTRTVIMTVMHSLKKQGHDPVARLASPVKRAPGPPLNRLRSSPARIQSGVNGCLSSFGFRQDPAMRGGRVCWRKC